MKRIAIVGTQGVPAQYGGFETLVENLIGVNRSYNIKYTVFCSAKDYDDRRKTFKRAKLRYIPLFHANGAQSIFYDILSLMCCKAISIYLHTLSFSRITLNKSVGK